MWPNCTGVCPNKKAALRPLFPPIPTNSNVVVLDFGDLGGVVVMPGAAIHPAREQVVDDADDRQQQQQENQAAAHMGCKAEEPEQHQYDNRQPDQIRQDSTSANGQIVVPSNLIITISSI